MPPSPGRTALYRLYDIENRLLYVGIATNPAQRWAVHATTQTWWTEVAMREIEWFTTRTEAETAEARAIDDEHPEWNKKAGTDRSMRGPGGRYWLPDDDFKRLAQRFRRAESTAVAARRALELAVVREFKAGASAAALARHVPWPDKTIYAIAKSHGVPRLKPPTVGREAKTPPAE